MYEITVPANIMVRNILDGKDVKDYTFAEYIKTLLHGKQFAASVANLRTGQQVLKLFDNAKAGDVCKVHPNDFKLLKEVAEQPGEGGYTNAAVAIQLLPFIDAVLEAKKVE